MNRLMKSIRTAGVSGTLTAVLTVSAMQVSAGETSSFSTEVESNNSTRVSAIERAGSHTPTTVRETGAGINGSDSLADTASGISSVVNKGAQEAQADLAAANAQIATLKAQVADLAANSGTPESTNQTEEKTANGYTTQVKYECVQEIKQSCYRMGNVTYYAYCRQVDTYISGTWVRSSITRTSNWAKGGYYNQGDYTSKPKCSGTNPIT
jgi:hypothetical protein